MYRKVAQIIIFSIFSTAVSANHDHQPDEYTYSKSVKLLEGYKQWVIGANRNELIKLKSSRDKYPGNTYNLKGMKNKKFFQYEKQGSGRGINLGWTKTASRKTAEDRAKWFFFRESGSSGSLKYGEEVAIGWDKSKSPYIYYSKRRVGVNLNWTKKPRFEWTVLGGRPGTMVKTNQKVILYNIRHQQPLMWFDRTIGGNIGWPDSQRIGLQTAGKIFNSFNKKFGTAVHYLRMPGRYAAKLREPVTAPRKPQSKPTSASTTYRLIRNSAVKGHNKKKLTKVSVVKCQNACDSFNWCTSFDYNKKKSSCHLSDVKQGEVGGLNTNKDKDYYEKVIYN